MATSSGRISEERAHVEVMVSRTGAVLLPLGVILFVVSTAFFHPSEQHPMDNRAVFMEYAQDEAWIATHFVQWLAAMFLIGGLIPVQSAIAARPEPGAAIARFGLAAAIVTATAFTMLQAVDGVALKWAVDAWADVPPEREIAAFAAAESVRWIEYALQSYSNVLLGLTLILFALATMLGTAYPRRLAWLVGGSGIAWVVHGAMVPYVGFFDSVPRLVAIVLLILWSAFMAPAMWRAYPPLRPHSESRQP